MIIEAFKIVSSVFPFIKEAFLWRDGADADKPVTPADLRKRKFAVFVLFASLVLNYLTVTKLFEGRDEHLKEVQQHAEDQARYERLQEDQKTMVQATSCVAPDKVFELVNKQIDTYVQLGILQKVNAPPEAPPKGRHR